ncbi:peptide deformylase [Thermaurantimonas aggregans]|uniref:Peptide deformylase n=1 Tax=Thermaurantimonas aggregans TaxID=2173829 RepID=A0A401XK88_9FLAO|nr:peptide deformylase [Thermaurantimonas aggregans]MCX8148523.1 peptide deformylase [Thermaurantimonas aggregans]GCD77400.1 peptide deformylase [Thermaurantimonas aggregans]
MILPIVAYGDPVLKRKSIPIDHSYKNLNELIANMWETMYQANGVGLAAPQIGLNIRLFIVDATPFAEDPEYANEEGIKDFKKVFINAQILEESGEKWAFNEGCLSIPEIREDVSRHERIRMTWFDENFQEHTGEFDGIRARIIQHEYDHIEGILFTDRLSPLRKRLIKGKLDNILKGKVSCNYKIRFYNK